MKQTNSIAKAFELGRSIKRDETEKQAREIARHLLTMASGRIIGNQSIQKLMLALAKKSITFAIVQNDRTLKVEMPWGRVRGHTEAEITEWIVQQMERQEKTLQ